MAIYYGIIICGSKELPLKTSLYQCRVEISSKQSLDLYVTGRKKWFTAQVSLQKDRMMIKTECQLKMAKKYKKVFHFYPAFNDTFFFIGQKDARQDCAVHVNIKGQILLQQVFNQAIECIGMLSDKCALVFETRSNKLVIFHLQSKKIQRCPHQFMFEQSDRSELIMFPKTRLACVLEKGKYGDCRLKLTYYHYDHLCQGKTTPFGVFQGDIDVWTYENLAFKGNNRSMICWFNPLFSNGLRFSCYSLDNVNTVSNCKGGQGGSVETHYIELSKVKSLLPKKAGNIEIGLLNVWEMGQNLFFLVCITSCDCIEPTTKYFVYDSLLCTLRESTFSIGRFQDYVINIYQFGKRTAFMTWLVEEERMKPSSIFYMDNETEGLISEQEWDCTNFYSHQTLGYDEHVLVQCGHTFMEVERFDIELKRLLTAKELYLHLMLQLQPDLDEQLMCSVLSALYYSG